MLTIDEVAEFFENIEYKPSSSFEWDITTTKKKKIPIVKFHVLIRTRDTVDGKLILLQGIEYHYKYRKRKASIRRLAACVYLSILETEEHEAAEWLKYHGEFFVDPHPVSKKGKFLFNDTIIDRDSAFDRKPDFLKKKKKQKKH